MKNIKTKIELLLEENKKLKQQIKHMDKEMAGLSEDLKLLQYALSEALVDDLITEAIKGVTESKGN